MPQAYEIFRRCFRLIDLLAIIINLTQTMEGLNEISGFQNQWLIDFLVFKKRVRTERDPIHLHLHIFMCR